MPFTLDFNRRSALVTGGARGIGRTITEALIKAGVSVHVFDLVDDSDSYPFPVYKVDIGDADAVRSNLARLPDDLGLLVNNAGITRDKSLIKMSDDDWQQVIKVNLGGAFNLIRALAPRMKTASYGRIVNITSINGLRGKFGQANYTAAKAGLIGLSKTAARELGAYNITVNAVAPGMVLTDMAKKLPQEILDKAQAETVTNKLAKPEDIANTVLFLLSSASSMITGEVIRVDGGQYI